MFEDQTIYRDFSNFQFPHKSDETYVFKLNGKPYKGSYNIKYHTQGKRTYYTGAIYNKNSVILEYFSKGILVDGIIQTPMTKWVQEKKFDPLIFEVPIYSLDKGRLNQSLNSDGFTPREKIGSQFFKQDIYTGEKNVLATYMNGMRVPPTEQVEFRRPDGGLPITQPFLATVVPTENPMQLYQAQQQAEQMTTEAISNRLSTFNENLKKDPLAKYKASRTDSKMPAVIDPEEGSVIAQRFAAFQKNLLTDPQAKYKPDTVATPRELIRKLTNNPQSPKPGSTPQPVQPEAIDHIIKRLFEEPVKPNADAPPPAVNVRGFAEAGPSSDNATQTAKSFTGAEARAVIEQNLKEIEAVANQERGKTAQETMKTVASYLNVSANSLKEYFKGSAIFNKQK